MDVSFQRSYFIVGEVFGLPNIKSAKKRVLVSEARNARNKANRSALKTAIKKFEAAAVEGNRTEAEGAYPIVLVSYDIVCPAYKDTKQAEFAKAWLTYVTSDEGQKAAQDAAGTAPLPSSLKSKITKSIEAIKTK